MEEERIPNVSFRDYIDVRFALHDERHGAEAEVLSAYRLATEERLSKLAELRSEFLEDRGAFIRREVFEAVGHVRDEKIAALENWRSKAIGVAAVLMIIAGVVGAAVMHAFS